MANRSLAAPAAAPASRRRRVEIEVPESRPSAPAIYRSRVAVRRILPLDVLSTAPGRARTTVSGGTPIAHVDALLTNFHLPRSSLLMLVCAFAGREAVLRAYHEAVAAGYRFYSYGDAMLIV